MDSMKKEKYWKKDDYIELPPIPNELIDNFNKLAYALNMLNENFLDKLSRIYEFTDKYNEFVDTFSVCEKGCAHCCYIEVFVTNLEISYIESKTNFKRNAEKKHSVSPNQKCPFLDENNACKIYQYRPYGCRTFHVLDHPQYCEEVDTKHQTYGMSGGKGIPMLEALNMVIRQMNRNEDSGDLRAYFE